MASYKFVIIRGREQRSKMSIYCMFTVENEHSETKRKTNLCELPVEGEVCEI